MSATVYKTRRTRGEAGFSFIDVMMALVILTIGVLALADLQAATLKRGISSQRLISAITVAEQKIEVIKKTPYANIVAEPPTQVTASGMTYTRQVTVANDSPLVNTKTVTVTVTWSDGSRNHTVPTATIIAQ
jgi:type IV pilus assembly protein PilV